MIVKTNISFIVSLFSWQEAKNIKEMCLSEAGNFLPINAKY